jgi:hypothetical protein
MYFKDKFSFLFLDFIPKKGPLCVQLLWGVLSMVFLPIFDNLQPPQQGLHEVPQELHRIFSSLIWSLKNPDKM